MYFLGINGLIAKERAKVKKLKSKIKGQKPMKKLRSKVSKNMKGMKKKIMRDFKKIGPTNVIKHTVGADKQARGLNLLHNA